MVSVRHGAILHGCTIGNDVLVGMGAIVMNGQETIGESSILGAGTVVTEAARENTPHSVVLGVPGKVIRQTTEEQDRGIIANAESDIELAKKYRNG